MNLNILVVGAGPVGAVTALALAQQGISVTLLETDTVYDEKPRAATTHASTLEMLASLGIADESIAQGLIAPRFQHLDRVTGELVVSANGLKATGPTAVAQITLDEIRAGFRAVDRPTAEVLIHVGTNLPVSAITGEIEAAHGKPLIGVNVATYWQVLRRIGVEDRIGGFGMLLAQH